MEIPSIAERVAEGVKLLDRYDRDWRDRLLYPVYMEDATWCIVGQVCPDGYTEFKIQNGFNYIDMILHGFESASAMDPMNPEFPNEYEALYSEWFKYI